MASSNTAYHSASCKTCLRSRGVFPPLERSPYRRYTNSKLYSRPYLIFGVEEAVKEAQKGGSGVVIYFRKEGRALGEVTKYLVYNARMAP